ncbi:MAG: hypothetical protein RLZZ427_946 [Pseudomonadota bacterium]|jgi:HlyD family type I secretion membrane fusion protein
MNFLSKHSAEPATAISRQDNYLAKDILLKEAANPSYVRKTILLTCAGILGFVLWSTVAKVDVVTRAPGQLAPLSAVQVIQHLDGGRIRAINVADGQRVRRGAVLMTLDDSEVQADLETSRARYWALYGRHQRLRSFITGAAPNFSVIPEKYRQFAQEEATILSIAQGSRADELRVIRAQQHQAAAEATAVQELADIRGDLAREKLVSRTSYLDTVRVLNQLKGQQQALGYQASSVNSGRNRDAADQMGQVSTELAQLDEQVKKLEARLARMQIVAPLDGVVQGLAYRTVGGVIAPGAQVMNIVPVEDTIEADVRVAASDIGHIKIGQPVRLKISTYDFLRYGTLAGKVSMISANSTVTDRGEVYYLARVAVDRKTAAGGLSGKTLLSGMSVETDIVTDRQSVLHYLLAPVFRAVEGAFGER